MSGQYRSHVWSKLLIEVEEGSYSAGAVEIKGGGLPALAGIRVSAFNWSSEVSTAWVVAQVLYDGAAVRIGMRLRNLVFRQRGKSLEQQRPDLVFPEQVYDFLVRQNGIRKRAAAAHQQDSENECNNWRFSHVSLFLNEGGTGIRAPDATSVWRGGCFRSMTCSSPHDRL